MPARVRDAIRTQQENSEILVGWIQLSVVVTFGSLYLISPKTFSEDAPFQPVPWALAGYLLFTAVRLALAYLRRLPAWFLALSVVVDIGLLMGLIFSFHVQYEQPASFYLKAPTLLYVFIFIALRALRFEAGYVALTGLVAAAGWALMVLYVVMAKPFDTMITQDYVEYMTSNSVLLGAEFDKIVSILVVTAIISLALFRARRLLVRAVAEQAAAEDLSRFFAPEIADKIVHSEQQVMAGQGELRQAAILSVDLRGFTKLAMESEPDQVIGMLTEYQSRLVPAIQSCGGSIDKFLGDGIMATFGAAMETDSYAADALRAVDAIMASVDDWNADRRAAGQGELRVGASVATGPVIFGAVGAQSRLEYTVIGEAVNLAAKLEKHTKAEAVRALTTAETWELARQQGLDAARPPEMRPGRPVDGVAGTLDLVVLAA
ncbi:MAG: adenylate/guanylate cyclase domain-containing protein [Alphaproteobacteria bacterium]|nr:adenylate/guanylate cyclase domain-containing protein [Alphaproteobacteria bacterium]